MNKKDSKRKLIRQSFFVAMVIKAVDGLFELFGGLVLFLKPDFIQAEIFKITQSELLLQRPSHILDFLNSIAKSFNGRNLFFADLFLVSHGLIKLFLVWALLRKKLWAYPWGIIIFTAFAIYQTYQLSLTFSSALVLLTVLDIFVVILTIFEYRRLRSDI